MRLQFEPTTSGQVVVHGQVLDNFNKLVEFRRIAANIAQLPELLREP
jgi:hypothetical protein